jgi:copper resistance protein C
MKSTQMFRPSRRLLLTLTAAALAPRAAFAHASLSKSVPAAGATVAPALKEVELTFNEPVDAKSSGAEIVGKDNHAAPAGPAKSKAGDEATLVIPLTKALAEGAYTVHWHAVSRDGHRVTGAYRFSVKA